MIHSARSSGENGGIQMEERHGFMICVGGQPTNLVPYELEARMKIQEIERHWKDQLFAFFSNHYLLSASITKLDYAAVQLISS